MPDYRIVYASNGAGLGDGVRVARISGDGSRLEIMTDTRTGRFVEVVLKPVEAPASGFSSDFSPDFR